MHHKRLGNIRCSARYNHKCPTMLCTYKSIIGDYDAENAV